jgi:ubiquinone/menaquinone biosynthesis C-methylase UbiE
MMSATAKRLFFDAAAPGWLRDHEFRQARLRELFHEYALPAEAPVLDIGSGAGIMLPFLLERRAGRGPIIALEISAAMLSLAYGRYGSEHGLRYVQGDAHMLPFADAVFNTAMCFSVYPHFSDARTALAEIRRCVRPDGRLCILHLMGHSELNAMHRQAGDTVADDVIPPAELLAADLSRHGFRATQVEERSDLYLIIAERL